MSTALDLARYDALTFDCYGTLIDWETGLLAALTRLLKPSAPASTPEELLEAFARHEAALESGAYVPYRDVLRGIGLAMATERRTAPSPGDVDAFAESVGDWPPFADSPEALQRLARHYRLGVITNCDDDLFERSRRRLGIDFDVVVTAQQVRAYKPDTRGFERCFERLALPRDRILHVAQSLFHDHVPAQALGLATVWVDRRHGRPGFGATPAASAEPDLVVPDMRTLADLADQGTATRR